MRRRRRNRGTWFPTLGNEFTEGENTWRDAGFSLSTTAVLQDRALGPIGEVIALTRDFTQEPSATAGSITGPSLRDQVEGQDWLLQRLVGKLHVVAKANGGLATPAQQWAYVQVAAGFFVARSIDDDQSSPDLFFDEYDTLALDNIQNPWIWRRTWILRNPNITGGTTGAQTAQFFNGDFPISNAGYGSVMDGPHLDTKIKRRITREHRLWFALNAIGWNGEQVDVTNSTNNPFINAHLDLRIFGTMRKGKNESSF